MRLKLAAFGLRIVAAVLPVARTKRAYLAAYYKAWDFEHPDFFDCLTAPKGLDPHDVFNGHPFGWSRRGQLPVEILDTEMDRLANERLAAHDNSWDFEEIVRSNL